MPSVEKTVEDLAVDAIRILSAEMVQQARSGHPGAPMGLADAAFVLWDRHLRFDPSAADWPDRDRFVLSAGHASALLYSLLHLFGFDLPLEELRRFRQWGSRTPGHPEHGLTPGVEVTTGPLGQGFAHGVGMALAESRLAARFNRHGHEIVDHRVYGIVSDGDLQEGVSAEAASLAGHWGLGKVIYLYDANGIQIEGSTDASFTEDVAERFRAYHWHVVGPIDGHDRDAVDRALSEAEQRTEQPSLIIARTHIAYGSPTKQDTAAAHGAPLGEEELERVRQRLGWPEREPFRIPDAVRERTRHAGERGRREHAAWRERLAAYRAAFPDDARELETWLSGDLPPGWTERLDALSWTPGESVATRAASGRAIQALAPAVGALFGGSADLAPSTKTLVEGASDYSRTDRSGRNLRFGVREHAMGAIAGGMALHGGVIPYTGTFLVFSDYMRPAIRLAALMKLRVIYVFTHDSIGLGEDGPTHQPVEHLASLRAMPELVVIRPADAAETARAWRVALDRRDGPTALALSRQNVPVIDRARYAPPSGLDRGAYVLADPDSGRPDVVLMASGTEVAIALDAAERLASDGLAVRVVSFPSFELFRSQDASYRSDVLPDGVPRVAVEAATRFGWCEWLAPGDRVVSVERFGASAPAEELYRRFGLTPDRVAEEARAALGR